MIFTRMDFVFLLIFSLSLSQLHSMEQQSVKRKFEDEMQVEDNMQALTSAFKKLKPSINILNYYQSKKIPNNNFDTSDNVVSFKILKPVAKHGKRLLFHQLPQVTPDSLPFRKYLENQVTTNDSVYSSPFVNRFVEFKNLLGQAFKEGNVGTFKGLLSRYVDLLMPSDVNFIFDQEHVYNVPLQNMVSDFLQYAFSYNSHFNFLPELIPLAKKLKIDCNDSYTFQISEKIYGGVRWHDAVKRNNSRAVKWLLENNLIEINIKDASGMAALNHACDNVNRDIIELLLKNNATLLIRGAEVFLILHLFNPNFNSLVLNRDVKVQVLSRERLRIIKLLEEKKIIPKISSKLQIFSKILDAIIKMDDVATLQYFADEEIDFFKNYRFLHDLLLQAIEYTAMECTDYLLKNNVKVQVKLADDDGDAIYQSPLLYACELNNFKMIEYFLAHGHDVNQKDPEKGIYAIDILLNNLYLDPSIAPNLLKTVHLCLKAGADFSLSDDPDLVHKIVVLGDVDLVKLCINIIKSKTEEDFILRGTDQDGRTVWAIAAFHKKEEVLEFIRTKVIEETSKKERLCFICCDDSIDATTLLTPCYTCLSLVCPQCVLKIPKCQYCKSDF